MTPALSQREDRPNGLGHICWTIEDEASFLDKARAFLAEGHALGQKTAAFGPRGGSTLAALAGEVDVAADPYYDFLGEGDLVPQTMFEKFRAQTAIARDEGYSALRVVADMDWLLPIGPRPGAAIEFELLLDRVAAQLGASVVCAYRRASFDKLTVDGTFCVHPFFSGIDEPPPFSLLDRKGLAWELSGEVDRASLPAFSAAFAAGARSGPVFDVSGLDFVDVAGLRAVAEIARSTGAQLELRGASPSLRRHWQLAGFDSVAPGVVVAA